MPPQLQLSLLFGLGILLQVFFFISGKFKKGDIGLLLVCLIASLCTAAYIYMRVFPKSAFNLYIALFVFYAVFACFFYGFFQKKIFYEINELTLIVWNLVFWYTFILHFGFPIVLTAFFLVPSCMTLALVFMPTALHFAWKAFLYSWFLFMMIFLSFFHFKLSYLKIFFGTPESANGLDPFSVIFAGAVFLYVIMYSIVIVLMVPVPGEKQKFKDRMREVREHALTVSAGYSDMQVHHTNLLLMIGLCGTLLFLNGYTRVAPDVLVINIVIVMTFAYSHFSRQGSIPPITATL